MTTDRRPKDEASAVVSCRPRRQPWSRRRAQSTRSKKIVDEQRTIRQRTQFGKY